MNEHKSLDTLHPGQSGQIYLIKGEAHIHKRFLDLGLVEGTKVQCVKKRSDKGLGAYLIRGTVIAIRGKDAREIILESGEDSGTLQRYCTCR